MDKKKVWTIEEVRNVYKHNCSNSGDDNDILDPELLNNINSHIDYNIFIIENNVYSRDELLNNKLFDILKTSPEEVLKQQEINIFHYKDDCDQIVDELTEYYIRDVGETENFSSIKDDLYNLKNGNQKRGAPAQQKSISPSFVIKSRIYIAKDGWNDFKTFKNFASSMMRFPVTRQIMDKSFGGLLLEAPTESDSKLNAQNKSDIGEYINNSNMDLRSTPVVIEASPKQTANNTEVKLPSTEIPDYLFIIQPVSNNYDLYPGVDIITSAGDEGVDIPFSETRTLKSAGEMDGKAEMVDLGVKACLYNTKKKKYCAYSLMGRSKIVKTSLSVANSIGLIERGYRGNLIVGLRNHSNSEVKLDRKAALAQITPKADVVPSFVVVNEKSYWFPILNEKTIRGSGGFGSTGNSGNTSGKN